MQKLRQVSPFEGEFSTTLEKKGHHCSLEKKYGTMDAWCWYLGWAQGTLKIAKISGPEIYHKIMSQKFQITQDRDKIGNSNFAYL